MCTMPETLRFTRRNLPHWLVAERTYFITIRLAGTLPKAVVAELAAEREELRRLCGEDDERWTELRRRQFVRLENILDACADGGQWLTQPGIAVGLLESLEWLESQRGWLIHAAVVMSNHVHIVMRHGDGRSATLLEDLAHYKRYTARVANRRLGRGGRFWAREDFDHWCRSQDKVDGVVEYVLNNPVKAGLVQQWQDWPWLRIGAEYRVRYGLAREENRPRT